MTGTTVGAVLEAAARALSAVSDSPRLDAQMILAHVMDRQRTALLAHPEQALSADEEKRFTSLVEQSARGTPIPYLVGTRPFFRYEFRVSPAVLIPRPETEHIVEAALAWARAQSPNGDGLTLADIGTGSGVIALSLAAELPGAIVHATDISRDALEVARDNARRLGLTGVQFHQGDLLDALPPDVQPDLVVANLPYIPSDELALLPVSRYEPRLALDGGPDGLRLIRALIAGAVERLGDRFCLLLEIGAGQGDAVAILCQEAFPGAEVRVLPDYAGHDRVVEIVQ